MKDKCLLHWNILRMQFQIIIGNMERIGCSPWTECCIQAEMESHIWHSPPWEDQWSGDEDGPPTPPVSSLLFHWCRHSPRPGGGAPCYTDQLLQRGDTQEHPGDEDEWDMCVMNVWWYLLGCHQVHSQHFIKTTHPSRVNLEQETDQRLITIISNHLTELHCSGHEKLLEHDSVLTGLARGHSHPCIPQLLGRGNFEKKCVLKKLKLKNWKYSLRYFWIQ